MVIICYATQLRLEISKLILYYISYLHIFQCSLSSFRLTIGPRMINGAKVRTIFKASYSDIKNSQVTDLGSTLGKQFLGLKSLIDFRSYFHHLRSYIRISRIRRCIKVGSRMYKITLLQQLAIVDFFLKNLMALCLQILV